MNCTIKRRLMTYAIQRGDADAATEVMKMDGDIGDWDDLFRRFCMTGLWKWNQIETMISLQKILKLESYHVKSGMQHVFVSLLKLSQRINPVYSGLTKKLQSKDGMVNQLRSTLPPLSDNSWYHLFVLYCVGRTNNSFQRQVVTMIQHRSLFPALTDDALYDTFCTACEKCIPSTITVFKEHLGFDVNTYIGYRSGLPSRTKHLFGISEQRTPIPQLPLTPFQLKLQQLVYPPAAPSLNGDPVKFEPIDFRGNTIIRTTDWKILGRQTTVFGVTVIIPISMSQIVPFRQQYGAFAVSEEVEKYYYDRCRGIPLRYFNQDGSISVSFETIDKFYRTAPTS